MISESQVILYTKMYQMCKPPSHYKLECLVHESVGQLIDAQLDSVEDEFILKKRLNKLDQLIRELKVHFDDVCIDLEQYEYHEFVGKLAKLKPCEALLNYHFSIIELLKLMILRIKISNREAFAVSKVHEMIFEIINKHVPEVINQPIINDKEKEEFKKAQVKNTVELLIGNDSNEVIDILSILDI
jgi:hypothetical protein